MGLNDLISTAPKSIKPTLWVIGVIVAVALGTLYAAGAISGAAKTAAAVAVQSTADKIENHEKEDDKQWGLVAQKLDAIQQSVNETSVHLGKIDQWIQDQDADPTYAGPKHKRADR